MLGFGAYSELAFAETTLSEVALIAITAVVTQGHAGTLDYAAEASTLFNATTASGYVDLEFDAQAATAVVGVLSSLSLKDALDVEAKANTTSSAVTASFDLGIDYSAEALTSISSTSAATSLNGLADVNGQAAPILGTTTAYLSIFITDVDAYKIGKAFMFPVGASTSANAVEYDAEANRGIQGVTSSTATKDVDFSGKANITTSSVSLSGGVEEPAYIWGTAKVFTQSLSASLYQNLDNPTTDDFDYAAIADKYDTGRILYVLAYGDSTSHTVHIQEQNNTVYIDDPVIIASNTIYIEAQNNTVYINSPSYSSTTVRI